jgi:AraC-like DNA-binding protein
VLVLARDAVMRGFIADAIRDQYEIVDAADVKSAVAAATNGVRVDLVAAGCFMLGEPGAVDACSAVARELYEHCPWIPVVLVADTPPPALTADLLLTGVRAFMRREFTPDEFAATAARVGRRPDAAVPTPTRVAAIKGTFAVLEQAITDVPALASLAAMAHMSRSHFSRTFHAVAGIPLRDYVRDLRLKRAQELMRGSRLSLTSIATASGFYDLPHFNKAFRHRFGMSPTQFRLASLASSPPAA